MIFPYCWNRAWQEFAFKSFHVDASFETLLFQIIRADHEPSLCGEIRPVHLKQISPTCPARSCSQGL